MKLLFAMFRNLWRFVRNHFSRQASHIERTATRISKPCEIDCEIDIDALIAHIPHLSENSRYFLKHWASQQQSDDIYALIDCFRDYAQNVQEAYLVNDCFKKVEQQNTGFENRHVVASRYELHAQVLALSNSLGLSYEQALERMT